MGARLYVHDNVKLNSRVRRKVIGKLEAMHLYRNVYVIIGGVHYSKLALNGL